MPCVSAVYHTAKPYIINTASKAAISPLKNSHFYAIIKAKCEINKSGFVRIL